MDILLELTGLGADWWNNNGLGLLLWHTLNLHIDECKRGLVLRNGNSFLTDIKFVVTLVKVSRTSDMLVNVDTRTRCATDITLFSSYSSLYTKIPIWHIFLYKSPYSEKRLKSIFDSMYPLDLWLMRWRNRVFIFWFMEKGYLGKLEMPSPY